MIDCKLFINITSQLFCASFSFKLTNLPIIISLIDELNSNQYAYPPTTSPLSRTDLGLRPLDSRGSRPRSPWVTNVPISS